MAVQVEQATGLGADAAEEEAKGALPEATMAATRW